MPPLPSLLRAAGSLALLALGACSTSPTPRAAPQAPAPRIAEPAAPAGLNVLPAWRDNFEKNGGLFEKLDSDLFASESADTPLPPLPPELRASLGALVDPCALKNGETIVFNRIHGPETPFPDHQPLRMVAAARTALVRVAASENDFVRAESLAVAGLAQARATMESQAGLLPLIHALAVWESALDSVHALARSPALPEAAARRLLAALQADSRLAQTGLDRALRGEYHHVYRVVVERMPQTDSPDELLSSIGSLGMDKAFAPGPEEPSLGRTGHVLLDVAATLDAAQADLAPYLAAINQAPRLPAGLFERTTAQTLAGWRRELGDFYTYATVDYTPTPEELVKVRAALEAVQNPGGKLLACFMTPPWEVIIGSALRREAQRSALCGLLAWRIHGRPAPWAELAHLLPTPPSDPFSDGPLQFEITQTPRVWSVYLDGENGGGDPVAGNNGQPPDLVWRY